MLHCYAQHNYRNFPFPFSWMFLIFETLIVLKSPMWRVIYLSYTGNCEMMTGTHMILIQHSVVREFHNERGAVWPRASTAFRQRPWAGVDMCVGGNRASWLLKITTWLLLAQHIQLVFQSVGKESVAWQGFSAPLWISLLILWNAMRLIYLPTPFLQVWSGAGRPPDKSQLPCIGFSVSNNSRNRRLPWWTVGGLCAIQTQFLHPISSDNKHLEQCAIVWACDSERVNCDCEDDTITVITIQAAAVKRFP